MARGARFGVNRLVTPETLDALPALLLELVDRGCRDVLLLPAVGHPSLALSSAEAKRLAALLAEPHPGLVLKLGVCWGPELAHLPRLFRSPDCGAGREFLEITSDRHVRACSFHATAVPFETAEDVVAIWRSRQHGLGAPAGCTGCPRGRMPPPPPDARPAVRSYVAFASNNSGSYTLLGLFETAERAAEITALLNRLVADMEAAEPGQNPLRELLASAGIAARSDVGQTYDDWPAEWAERPEAVQVDRQVWWGSGYTVSMPAAIGHWFYAMGGRVNVELDHAHHPLLAHLSLWPDLPWKERKEVELQPLIDALWLGPLAADGVDARVRESLERLEPRTGKKGACAARSGASADQVIRKPRPAKLAAEADTSAGEMEEDWGGIEVLWLAPTPDQMRELVRTTSALGLACRLALSELPGAKADLDALWSTKT